MAGSVPNNIRDALITGFRYRIAEKAGVVPFPHQAAWWAASDGLILTDEVLPLDQAGQGMKVRIGSDPEDIEVRAVIPRDGGRAHVIADLGAFKIGKSFSSALWTASFACISNARVQLVGLEYDICEPEFTYLCEFLCSDQNGLGLNPASIQNRPRDGRMWLEFDNGARFEAKSWERKDSMKGKEVDLMLFCEAYMLPGLECYTSFSQNLRARDGYAVFATTPDRPWVKEIHNAAHSGLEKYKAWYCICSVHSSQNPYTFSKEAMERDKDLMTKEKYAIHYEGKLGDFIGRVYAYQRGERQFNHTTHPILFRPGSSGTRGDIVIPDGWELIGGADTGTHSSAVIVAFSPEGEAFVIDEFPNYSYTAGAIERDPTSTIPEWAGNIYTSVTALGAQPNFWADKNTQFKRELGSYRNFTINLMANSLPLEARTEICREYFTQKKVWLAPWLSVLPFELENAQWPEEATAAGRFQRVKDRDHTLDCFEHVLSKRPRGPGTAHILKPKTWIEGFAGRRFGDRGKRDRHLGSM